MHCAEALRQVGVGPGGGGQWSHSFVQAQFAGELVGRRKLYAAELRDALLATYTLRETADYKPVEVSRTHASRALRRARSLVQAVRERGGRTA